MPLDYTMNGYNPLSPALGYGSWDNFFAQAWNTPNLNNPSFKGSTSSSAASDSISIPQTVPSNPIQNIGFVPSVQTPTAGQNEDSGLVKTLIGGTIFTIGATACIVAAKKGKFSQLWNWGKKLIGKGEEVVSGSSQNVLNRLTAVRTKDGMRIMIPGKKGEPIKGEAAVKDYAKRNFMTDATGEIPAEKLRFTSDSALSEFQVSNSTGVYKVTVKDGKITNVTDTASPDINILERLTSAEAGTPDASNLKCFNNIISELGKDAEKADKNLLSGVADINYVNTFGDDIFELSISQYGSKNPLIKQLTTLERFEPGHDEVRKYVLKSGEEFFGNKDFLNGTLVDGAKVGTFTWRKIGGTNINANFDGRELVSITENGVTFPKGSQGYIAFMEEKSNKKAVEKVIKQVFEKHEIPEGAVITA